MENNSKNCLLLSFRLSKVVGMSSIDRLVRSETVYSINRRSKNGEQFEELLTPFFQAFERGRLLCLT